MAYLETICIKNGRVRNIRYHNDRCNRTRAQIYGTSDTIDLRKSITEPTHLQSALVKCRITYAQQVIKVEYEPYAIKPIRSLQLVQADEVVYNHKAADRQQLTDLYHQRGQADDIIMVRDGLLTDTYYGNIALWDGKKWHTPAKPMLLGTRRQQLLDQGRIVATSIEVADLAQYQQIAVFNAMIPFGSLRLSTSAVRSW